MQVEQSGVRLMTDWTPIGHRPPLPPIDIAPRHPITPAEELTMWEIAAEQLKEQRRRERAEVIWKLVEQTARGTNMPSRQPVEAVAGIPTPDADPTIGTKLRIRLPTDYDPDEPKADDSGKWTKEDESAALQSEISRAFGTCWKHIAGRWVQVDPETGREIVT